MTDLYDTVDPHGHRQIDHSQPDPADTKYGVDLVDHAVWYGLTESEIADMDTAQTGVLRAAGIL